MKLRDIEFAVGELKQGKVVCLPTETVYGLAADANNTSAINKLYLTKKRPDNKPTSIAICNPCDIKLWAHYSNTKVTEDINALISYFWPGPLTLLFPASQSVPKIINKNTGKIAIRYSSNQTLQSVIKLLGHGICLTSANFSGEKDGTIAQKIEKIFPHLFVLEENESISGSPSTIIDLSTTPYEVLREGNITLGDLERVLGRISVTPRLILVK